MSPSSPPEQWDTESTLADSDSDNGVSLGFRMTGILDDDGDLTLAFAPPDGDSDNPDEYWFLVCRRTLCRVSPVFKAQLGDGSEDPHDFLALPADDSRAVGIVLLIAHSDFRRVPASLGTGRSAANELHNILVFGDKYGMSYLLVPWLQGWLAELDILGSGLDDIGIWPAIAIAKELGAERIVARLVRRLIIRSDGDDEDDTDLPLVHSELAANADKIRIRVLLDIVGRLQQVVLGLQQAISAGTGVWCGARFQSAAEGLDEHDLYLSARHCQATTLGIITATLNGAGYGPLLAVFMLCEPVETEAVEKVAINHFTNTIRSMEFQHCSGLHHACDPLPDFVKRINEMTASVDDHLTQETLDYMANQRAKLGDLPLLFPGEEKGEN